MRNADYAVCGDIPPSQNFRIDEESGRVILEDDTAIVMVPMNDCIFLFRKEQE